MIVSRPATKVALSPQQTFIAFLLFLMIVLNYLDRQILSVLAPVMRKEIGLTPLGQKSRASPLAAMQTKPSRVHLLRWLYLVVLSRKPSRSQPAQRNGAHLTSGSPLINFSYNP
jgi:hypothetical protein